MKGGDIMKLDEKNGLEISARGWCPCQGACLGCTGCAGSCWGYCTGACAGCEHATRA